jgi:F-type H+-transporting ATPase subunit gamma
MAKGMREIKRQIKSTQNMKQITKAMEMIAAARLRKAQEAALASRPYADKMKEVVSTIAAGSTHVKHPMLQVREVKKTGYFVITSDRGLAGGYNANLLRTLTQTIRAKHSSTNDYMLFVIGRKGRDFFRKREMPIAGEVTGLTDDPKFADIKSLMTSAVKTFEDGGCDELILVYNQFINAISQKPVELKLLPLTDIKENGQIVSYEYEPSPEGVLNVLLPKYTETVIFSSLLEAKASEFGAKMTAMGSASKNASEMIKKYTLVYNRARQAAITQEISEIVAGANAQG